MSPRRSTLNSASVMCLMWGWSGATPYRTNPYGAGSFSKRSIETSRSVFERMSAA